MKHILKIFSLLFISVFLLQFTSQAQTGKIRDLIKKGNSYYANSKYDSAIVLYKKALNFETKNKTKYESAALYYNLANAYFRTNDIPNSILYYERAKLLDPSNEDIDFNLNLAQQQTVDKIESLPEFFLSRWIRSLINSFSSNTWALISMISFVLFLVLFSLFLFIRIMLVKKLSFFVGVLMFLVATVSFVFSHQQKQAITNREHAIVFAPTVTVKSSPDKTSTDLFILHEGTKIKITDEQDNWREIKLSDGKVGWLPVETMKVI